VSRYELTPLARFDMREIWAYSAQQWGRRRANRYIRDLTVAIENLAKDPYLGVNADEVRLDYRKHVFGSHLIYYSLSATGVIVVRVLHQQMDALSRLS
jgi:toxin ParE1/3/4